MILADRRRDHIGAGSEHRSRLFGLEDRGTSIYTIPANWRSAEGMIPTPLGANCLANSGQNLLT